MKNFLLILMFFTSPLFATELTLEAGGVSNPYNRVAIPGDDGTAFHISKAFRGQLFYHRISLSHKLNDRHGVRFLYAPLRITGDANFGKDINFLGVNFPRGKTSAEYQFNSYRASWFYQVIDEGPWQTRLGVTAKVRDAKTKLFQNGKSKTKKNSGIVPLLYQFTKYQWKNGFSVAVDFDGWAAPQGRAIDVGVMAGYAFLSNLDLNFGYRVLEGGVDNDKVYNFSRLEYLFSSINWEF